MKMQKFIKKPEIDFEVGIIVNKDTELTYKSKNLEQQIKQLKLRTKQTIKGEIFKSKLDTTICLQDGDILIFDGKERGFIKPVETFMCIEDAINELKNVEILGKEVVEYDITEKIKK